MDTDLQLLDCYARTRDAEAFKQLVGRHAGMVFAAARRITSDHHDAEEVAQSCFLELSRQAGSIHGSVAGWLHSVATTHAAKCNRSADRRRRRERNAARPEGMTEAPWEDIGPLVDEALAELPEELRLPVVLYYLEDRSQAEVAAELGINQSTVSRRVEAGVAALHEKLQAAGVEAPGVALPALLAQYAIVAAPKTLMAAMGKLAVSGLVPAAAGGGGGSGGAALASGVSSAATKGTSALALKILAAVVLTAIVTTAGVELLPAQQPGKVVSAGMANGNTINDPSMSGELKDIFERLKAEETQGLGDGVTILTFTSINPKNPQPRITHPGTLKLYAQQGKSRFYLHYEPGPKKDWGNPKARLPVGWPTPGLDETLRFVDQLQTPYLEVTDGRTWWRTQLNDGQKATLLSSRVDEDVQTHSNVRTIASNYFWPEPDLLAAASENRLTSIELLHQPQNPSVVGLHFIQKHTVDGEGDPIPILEHTYWMDPGRNDVPVEEDLQDYNKKGERQKLTKWIYLDYAQLPDGRWYPTHLQRLGAGSCIDYRVLFFPGKILDPKWFADPTARFAGDPGNAVINALPVPVATATRTITTAVPKAIAATATTIYRSPWWAWPWILAAVVFGTAGVLLIRQRHNQSPASPLRGAYGPRRK